jgi:aspartyl aminopeptidase
MSTVPQRHESYFSADPDYKSMNDLVYEFLMKLGTVINTKANGNQAEKVRLFSEFKTKMISELNAANNVKMQGVKKKNGTMSMVLLKCGGKANHK